MSLSFDCGYWRLSDGRRALLCWNPRTGQLVLHYPDGVTNPTLAVIPDETEMRRRLEGWADHAGTKDGLTWLAGRLEGCR